MWNGEIRGDDSRRGERPSAASVHHRVKPVERPAGEWKGRRWLASVADETAGARRLRLSRSTAPPSFDRFLTELMGPTYCRLWSCRPVVLYVVWTLTALSGVTRPGPRYPSARIWRQ
jgi:hypothetical protein